MLDCFLPEVTNQLGWNIMLLVYQHPQQMEPRLRPPPRLRRPSQRRRLLQLRGPFSDGQVLHRSDQGGHSAGRALHSIGHVLCCTPWRLIYTCPHPWRIRSSRRKRKRTRKRTKSVLKTTKVKGVSLLLLLFRCCRSRTDTRLRNSWGRHCWLTKRFRPLKKGRNLLFSTS